MSRYIELASTDMRLIVKSLLELGKLGAKLQDDCPAFKIGPLYTTKVVIDDDSRVEYLPHMRRGIEIIEESKIPEVSFGEKLSIEQLSNLSLKQLRDLTNTKSGKSKDEMIKEYLAN